MRGLKSRSISDGGGGGLRFVDEGEGVRWTSGGVGSSVEEGRNRGFGLGRRARVEVRVIRPRR